MDIRRFKLSAGHQKFGILLAIIIAGALLISYGFNRIETQQRAQDAFTKQLHSLIVRNEALAKTVAKNTAVSMTRQRASDLVLCEKINEGRPPPPKLNCSLIDHEALTAAAVEGN